MSKNTVALIATGQAIPAGAGTVRRLIVNTHSSGVIQLNDSPTSAVGRVILSAYTLPAGAQVLTLDEDYSTGVWFTLVSGTATIQLTYDPSVNV